ncbi:MAG TPA: hypothetical protein VGS27_28135 [Candidatus Sulfotelmatobacter sp.]|nr:hypothetical protein [Candidatus Sulfotelmatobacter sp.]
MAALATRVESRSGKRLTAEEIFEITRARERSLSRMLMLYISTGLVFMLLPGTFLGVWNLLAISSRHAANSVSAGWIQAHGHAQIFGWIGTFILGIGFYSIPKLRRANPFALWAAWLCWALWTSGVTLRWLTGVYQWQWRVVLPVSAALEVVAFVIFFHSVSGHRPQDSGRQKLDEWVLVVIAAAAGLLLTLLVNLGAAMWLAYRGTSPDLPTEFDQRFLVLETWGFLVPFVWGFSSKWLPVFLGLRPVRGRVLLLAVAVNSVGVIAAMTGWMRSAVLLLLGGIIVAVWALRFFERTQQPAKVKGVHPSFPVFVRLAYVWAIVAAALGLWASSVEGAHGIWGASRHALTVGFLATMVFSVGQRILPAFSGMRLLFNTRLMFLSLLLLTVGCLLRVSSEILAYQDLASWAWSWLPVSAITEMAAVTIFAVNLFATFARRPPSAQEAGS